MALTEQQKQDLLSKYGNVESSVSQDDVIDSVIESTYQQVNKPKETGFWADIKGIGTGIKEAFQKRTEKVADIKETAPNIFARTRQTLGQGAGLVSDVIGETAIGGIKALTPLPIQEAVGGVVEKGVGAVARTQTVQNMINDYQELKKTNPNLVNEFESALGFLQLGADVVGLGVAGKGAKAGVQLGKEAIETGTTKAIGAVKPVVSAVGKTVEPVTNVGKRFTERIGTNVADYKATQKAISELPTPKMQKAVKNGVELSDAQTISRIAKTNKEPMKKLYENIKNYALGKTKINPIETVGKPIVTRVKMVQNQVTRLGNKLDRVASSLKGKTVKGVDNVVNKTHENFDRLGIKVVDPIKGTKLDNVLDFTGSALEGLPANKLINTIYTRLINANDALDLHRLKRFIDNNVEFGKKVEGLTGDAERLLKDMRKQIDTALDTQFKPYKSVNDELAQRLSPLRDMQKLLKDMGFDDDLLNMKAGLLARRLTSNAVSNPQVRQILRNLDKATKKKGMTTLKVEDLQDAYNALAKYFPEIEGKTALKGQITEGIENVKGVSELIGTGIKKLSGQTEAVRRKAIIDALDELFK